MSGSVDPVVKTVQDKGTKIDWVSFNDGRAMFIFLDKVFKVQVVGFKIETADKYQVFSPESLTSITVDSLLQALTTASGLETSIEDVEFNPHTNKKFLMD